MFWSSRLEHEVIALIGRVVAKAAKSETGRTCDRLRHQIARVDRFHALHQGQGGFSGRDRDEQAFVWIDRSADRRFDGRIWWRQARPQIRKVDAFMRARTALDAHADRCWLDVEEGA